MKDDNKTKGQLIKELAKLRHRIAELETIETEHKQAKEALQESEERFRDLFEKANDLILSVDLEGKFAYVNRKFLEILEYTEDEVEELTLKDILRKDQITHCMELFNKICKGEIISKIETVFISKNGKETWVEGNVNSVFKDGEFIACRGIFRDITKRKLAEEELRDSRDYLDHLLNSIYEGVIVGDRNFAITDVNRCFLEQHSIAREEVIGQHCMRSPIKGRDHAQVPGIFVL